VSERLISLAAATVIDVGPADAVDVAARAGFGAVGIWFDPTTWAPSTPRVIAGRLAATGIVALDIEPVIFGRGPDHGEALIDAAVDMGVRHVLVASGPADRSEVVERFAALCDRATGSSLTLVLEFLPIFSIGSLDAAVSVVIEAGYANGAVLVDSLHLARSGGTPADLAGIAPQLLPYLQIADAPAVLEDSSPAGLREEALYGRLLPGQGDLPLADLMSAVPDVPLSVEMRSRQLMIDYPDPLERARAVLAAMETSVSGHPGRA
jgi:sugar phosphate isomerase/epimerase